MLDHTEDIDTIISACQHIAETECDACRTQDDPSATASEELGRVFGRLFARVIQTLVTTLISRL